MNRQAILHQPFGNMAYADDPDHLVISLRAGRNDLQRVTMLYADLHTRPRTERELALRLAGRDAFFDYWEGRAELSSKRFSYCFLLENDRERLYYGEGGFNAEPPRDAWQYAWQWCFAVPYAWWSPEEEPPSWAKEAVVYSIFPERFTNGDPANDPPDTQSWGARPTPSSFFGGDLQGILDNVDHLAGLGVNCLYLTPIFCSPSNHKYDTADYLRIDPIFGDEQLARELVSACHAKGIRVILDAVFNHCGFLFPPFQDVVRQGAASPYADWFRIESFPVVPGHAPNYETFATGAWTMPKLRTDRPEVREYLLGVAEYWTRTLDIDGWRLDVADEVCPAFWREFRRRIRALKPEALIIGEITHEASSWLYGDMMDGVMNYPWQHLCVEFFADRAMTGREFAAALTGLKHRCRKSAWAASWNLLDSHDRRRILTACRGDQAALKLATLFQFSTPGAPFIYYGTEVGLPGEEDPDCRRCMPWDQSDWDLELYRHYRVLIKMRREHPLFTHGEMTDLLASPHTGLYVFARWDGDETAIVCLNNAREPAVVSSNGLLAGAVEFGIGEQVTGRYERFFMVGATEAERALLLEDITLQSHSEVKLWLPAMGAVIYLRRSRTA